MLPVGRIAVESSRSLVVYFNKLKDCKRPTANSQQPTADSRQSFAVGIDASILRKIRESSLTHFEKITTIQPSTMIWGKKNVPMAHCCNNPDM